MNERIKKLRKALDLTQQEFAMHIGSKRNTIAKYETGTNAPSAAVVSLICREFNVSEEWLREGTGEMFLPDTADDPIAAIVKQYHLIPGYDELLRRVVELSPPEQALVVAYVKSLAASISAADTAPPAPMGGQDLAAEVAELKRQNQELTARLEAIEEEDAAWDALHGSGGGGSGEDVG